MDRVDWTYAARKLAEARRRLLLPADDEVDAMVDAAFKVAVAFVGLEATGDPRIDDRLGRVRRLLMPDDAASARSEAADRARWRRQFERLTPRERVWFAETVADLAALARRRSERTEVEVLSRTPGTEAERPPPAT